LVENAVGAHLLNGLGPESIGYWRDGDAEVDFTISTPRGIWSLEVKSGKPENPHGMAAFLKKFPKAKPLRIGSGGIPLERFFSTPAADHFVG
jgi:hypothetical protein